MDVNYMKMIERLERENEMVDTKESQKQANEWRIRWIKMMNRPKAPVTPYKRLDMIGERLNDSDFRVSPSKLLSD